MMRAPAVYSTFRDFEEQAASIYVQMAARFSPENVELGEFWLDMGMQEKQHAGLVEFCLAEELFSPDLPGEKQMRDAGELLGALRHRAADPNLTVSDSFEIARELETCEINELYERLTTPTHASVYLLRRKIASSLPGHIEELARQARRFKVNAETLAKLEALKVGGGPL
jgi:rubrerythrin